MSPAPLILVVDDDPFMREVTRVHLEAVGFEVALADGAADGLAKAQALKPTIIVMDFAMPGQSGAEALAQLRSRSDTADTPVLMLTAWTSESSRLEAEALGATWLSKPVLGDALIEAILRLTPQ